MTNGPTLRQWSVRNFKSIAEAELTLAPLTLLVGKNSAGKSSVIQSLLLFAQSSIAITDGSIPLNDTLTSLGPFEDAHSRFAETPSISFAGEFALQGRNPSSFLSQGLVGIRRMQASEMRIRWSCDLIRDIRTDEARIGSGVFEREQEGDDLDISFSLRTDSQDLLPEGDPSQWGPYDVNVISGPSQSSDDFEYAQFTAAVPMNGLRRWISLEWWIRDIYNDMDTYRGPSLSKRKPKQKRPIDIQGAEKLGPLHARLVEYVSTSIQQEANNAQEGVPFHANVIDSLKLSPSEINLLIANFDEVADGLRSDVPPVIGMDLAFAEELRLDPGSPIDRVFASRYNDAWQQFWARRVKYLGPLREEPRAAYPRHRSNVPFAPLGIKGEFFASFLQQNQAQTRPFPLPGGSIEHLTLIEALNRWLRYLHVAQSVEVVASGRLGLEILIDGHNVTSVGTGVSQLLPVLVVCLWAQEGTLTLIEQPEIHVEPGAQQLLAEFLLTIAQSGRQLLVETHSEYLITRLRLATAKNPGVAEDFAIYFAEQEDGRSQFRRVEVASTGGIEDWPAGFFDQASHDARELMLAAIKAPPSPDAF